MTASPPTDARRTALAVLEATARGRRLDRAFADAAGHLEPRERRFAQELAYGTVRLRGRLDHLLDAEVRGGIGRLSPRVTEILRLGAFQLAQLDGVPDYAGVSATVELARAVGEERASGLVNGVLRALARNGTGPDRFPSPEDDPVGHLASWGSHPAWLVQRWLERATIDEVRRRVESDNRVPPLGFVPFGDLDEAAATIETVGGHPRAAGRGSGALWVEGIDPSTLLESVPGFIQDPGASLVARYAAPEPGGVVADLCAAPGGKALYLARSAAYVVAVDPSEPRLALLRENVARSGLPVGAVRGRAEAAPVGGADLVLADVPCSGTGTLRRHPDARWRLDPRSPSRLAPVQARLLEGARRCVPVGGLLVYSTCTLEPEENEERVGAFLADHPGFRVEPPPSPLPDVTPEGWLRVLPENGGFDGAFAARLRRVE